MNDASLLTVISDTGGKGWDSRVWGLLALMVVAGAWMAQVQASLARMERGGDSLDASEAAPISDVRRDSDGDFVPDRVGDTVTVRGRTSVKHGVLPDTGLVYMQDETSGIAVHLPGSPAVQRGDSLRVTGVVRHQYGLTRLHALDYDQPETESRVPSAIPLTVTTANGEAHEGELVQIRGKVVANRTNDGGRYLLLQDRAESASVRIAAFVPTRRRLEIPLDRFEVGDEVDVTGILAQNDYSAPYDEYYQVLPRDADDVSQAGIISPYYQTLIIILIAGGLLAAIAVFTLRVAVKRRTQQLAESKARFRRLAEATFEGIIIHEEGQILDVNRALTDMIGYDRDDLVGRDFLDVLSASTQDLVRDTIQPSPDEPYEAVMVRRDGSSFPAEIEEKEVDLPDRSVRVAAIRNVTERKKWETEILLAKEEAEQMAKLKSSLLNNMSHELRTPITSIVGYAELIMEDPEADHRGFASRIRHSGERLSRTLQSVLEMAQIESGTLDVQPHDVDVGALVREVVEEHRPMGEDEPVFIEVSVAEAVDTLYTDRALVYRALDNLVHNAVKFTEEGTIQVGVGSAEPGVQISVRDSGMGIDPDVKDDLFQPFKQESDGRARTHEGTGLGLTLTKRMVELLGGTVEIKSVKGEGSTFIIELPPVIRADRTEQPMVESEPA